MIAPQRRTQSYPVLLPRESRAPARAARASRTRPAIGGLLLAAVVMVALLGHVALQAGVAKAGVQMRILRAEIAQLERARGGLDAQSATLRAPARIERIAIERLGMQPPKSAQLAAVTVRVPSRAALAPREGWIERLRGWLGNRAAAAQEQTP
ncbi:MAG: hypothetical protein FJX78_08835 [Armatimonadetes bacterium]|nr:hypothetical protein [Armatimonadota bacterium]